MDRRGSDFGPMRRMGMGDHRDRDRDMPRDRNGPLDRERERDGMYGGPRMPRNFGRPGPMGPPGPRDFAGPLPVRSLAPAEPDFVVDREKTCPLLLRVWAKSSSHHRPEDFATRGQEPPGDIQVYTWMDATLRELSDLIKEVKPEARSRGSRLSFKLVYPDKFGRNVFRQVGEVHSSRPSQDDTKTLKSIKFQTGDFMDVAVLAGV